MNIIEEAAKRLEELSKGGVEAPADEHESTARADAGRAAAAPEPIPLRATRAAQAGERSGGSPGAIKRIPPQQPSPTTPDGGPNFRNIDFGRLQANGLITPAAPDSQLLHEFRIIKRPLIRNALGQSAAPIKNRNLIMVTSSLPREGKTFVSLNLAMSIAMEVDSTVLLVDADVVAPAIPRLLGIQVTKGLMDVLTQEELNVGDVMLRTNVDRLVLLCAGRPHPRASELLASEAMAQLVEEMASRYPDRIVIFDSPPLLVTTESRALAGHVGQVLVVVEAERTTHGVLENALSTIEACPIVLTMLNKANAADVGSYYGYQGYGR